MSRIWYIAMCLATIGIAILSKPWPLFWQDASLGIASFLLGCHCTIYFHERATSSNWEKE